MCRIANLFWVTEVEKRISGDARFKKHGDTSGLMTFFPAGHDAKENHAILTEKRGEHAPRYDTAKIWLSQFKCGDFSTCITPRPGRTKTVNTPNFIVQSTSLCRNFAGFGLNQ